MTSTSKLPPLPPLPTRTISTNLSDHDLDRLDHIRRMSPDLPPRAVLVREAILLWLDMHEDPIASVAHLIDGLTAMYGADETTADTIGETKGRA